MHSLFKYFFLIILFLFAFKKSNAQSFKGGIIAGIAACQVDGDGLVGYNKPGPVAGGFVTFNFNKTWSGEMQMVFIQKGARYYPNPTQAQQSNSQYINTRWQQLCINNCVRYKAQGEGRKNPPYKTDHPLAFRPSPLAFLFT